MVPPRPTLAQPPSSPEARFRHTRSLATFLRAPINACFVGEHLRFWHLGGLVAWKLWGAVDANDGRALVKCMETGLAFPLRRSLVDLRQLTSVDELGFRVLHAWVEANRERVAQGLVRQALIRPQGVVGAVVSGFYAELNPGHEVKTFASLEEGVRWLKVDRSLPMDALVGELDAPPEGAELLQRFSALFLEQSARATPRSIARALAMSVRTLQRRLREHGTSFHQQALVCRLTQARLLLATTDLKLSAIARESGFGSAQHLATVFKKELGVTPTGFRARRGAIVG